MAKKYNAPQMRRHLALRARHGLTWAELSDRVDIPVSSLQWWSARLAACEASDAQLPAASSTPFIELAVTEIDRRPDSRIEIELPWGATIRVPPGFDVEELRQVVAAVTSAC